MYKRVFGWVLVFVLVFGAVSPLENTYAVQNAGETAVQSGGELGSDLSVTGTNSFGGLLSDTLSEEAKEQKESNGCNIFSVEMNGMSAVVSFETIQDCTLVVGIYEEDGVKMLASGSMEVFAGETETVVDIETEDLPQYFYLRGFLVETDTLRPLAASYESPMYTQEMQEFLKKTTDDFGADKVLNLDEDTTNNFAVYSDETIQIEKTEGTNEIVTADEENNRYVIEHADSSITSLKKGDIFAYEYGEGEVLILKIDTIEINGTTATITGAETSMEEVFEYVKIDGEASTADAEVDSSDLEDGVVYNGLVEYEDDEAQTYAWDGEGKKSYALSYEFLDKRLAGSDNANVKLSGGLELKLESSVKFYVSFTYQYLEMKLDYSGKLKLSLSGKAEGKIPLAFIGISPVPGVIIELTPSFVVKISAKLDFSGKLTGTVGFYVSSDEGMRSLTSSPSLKGEIKGEVTLFAGLSLEPKVKIISEKIAEASLDVIVGGEIKGTLVLYKAPSTSKIHNCKQCIDGNISAKADLKFEVSLLNLEKLKFTYQDGISIKLFDFYYSFDYGEFAFTTCPHYRYKTTVTVVDKVGNKIANAKIEAPFGVNKNSPNESVTKYEDLKLVASITTDKNGKAIGYLPAGSYKLKITADKRQATKKVTIVDKDKKILVWLDGIGEGGDSSINPTQPPISSDSGNIKMLSLGGYHSGAITKDGSLYMWGYNYYGELGNGTTTNSKEPMKVLDNVASVSLGVSHSGAITKDGSLYMWGCNYDGELGNGTTTNSKEPMKVLDNVASVSLGGYHSGAITKDGSLYMWGRNSDGQLGNGTTQDSSVPVKVLDNVASISLGDSHSGAITKDGRLYMWGDNHYGELGNGTTTNSKVPVKVLDNVASVCHSGNNICHSGAITKGGSLYMWGGNYNGELGNGTTTNSKVPVKVLDNVASGSLGNGNSGAITKDGSLYMWGCNHYGKLGNGTTQDSSVPMKVLDNVASVSLGAYHSGAITKDGCLYMWGYNYSGQLGNGTTQDSSVPIKITIPPINARIAACEEVFNGKNAEPMSAYSQDSVVTDFDEKNLDDTYENLCSDAKVLSIDNTEFSTDELTVENPKSKAVILSGVNVETAAFRGLIPNSFYNFYAVKSLTGEAVLSPDNILYMNQAAADSVGELEVSYELREKYENAVLFVVGAAKRDLSGAQIELANLTYTGEEQVVNPTITYQGTTLVEGRDYELTGGYLATKVGEYTVTISGIGTFIGEIPINYQVLGNPDIEDVDASDKPQVSEQPSELPSSANPSESTEPSESVKPNESVKPSASVKPSESVKPALGDLNDDGKVTLEDARITLRVALNLLVLNENQKRAADVNQDGKVNLQDAKLILRKALNLINL